MCLVYILLVLDKSCSHFHPEILFSSRVLRHVFLLAYRLTSGILRASSQVARTIPAIQGHGFLGLSLNLALVITPPILLSGIVPQTLLWIFGIVPSRPRVLCYCSRTKRVFRLFGY